MRPTVDVIIPCFNYGQLLEACAASVLAQEDVDVRVMMMDDASTDVTEAVGRRLAAADTRVEYYRHDINRGHIATYNEALARVGAEYCMILSADDLLTPGALLRATQLMATHPDVGLVYGRDIPFTDEPPPATVARSGTAHRVLRYREFLESACRLGHTGIQSPTAVVRTSLHRMIGGYRPELPHSGDTEIWLRMAAHAPVGRLDADQAFRRLHSANMSLGYSPLRRLQEQKKAFEVHFADYRLLRPEIARCEPLLERTIAQTAFWSAARAFEDNDADACDEFLGFARQLWPAIESWPPWRRLRWKRRLGSAIWRRLNPMATFVRRVILPGTAGPVADSREVAT